MLPPDPYSRLTRFDLATETYHARYAWSDPEPLSTTIVTAVAEVIDGDVVDVEPLFEIVDPDALDAILRPTYGGTFRKDGGCVAFTLSDCEVTVYWDGDIAIRPPDGVDDGSWRPNN